MKPFVGMETEIRRLAIGEMDENGLMMKMRKPSEDNLSVFFQELRG